MTTRLIHPEAAQLSDSIDSAWRDVRRATTGNFATKSTLQTADAALARLLNSGTTELRLLRQRVRAELSALSADELERERSAA